MELQRKDDAELHLEGLREQHVSPGCDTESEFLTERLWLLQ